MTRLKVPSAPRRLDIVLRSSPDWTAVIFFAGLAAMHAYIAAASFLSGHWAGFLSAPFAIFFALAAIAFWLTRTEITICAGERRIHKHVGIGRFAYARSIPFSQVHSVRLTLLRPADPRSARIELLCKNTVIECPPTTIPRQEALCLAMTIGVRLIKVFGHAFDTMPDRLDKLPKE